MSTFLTKPAPPIDRDGIVNLSIEELLSRLGRYAFVNIHNATDDGTWSARAEMRIKTEGAEFTVRSGFGHASAKSALVTLLRLVENAVSELGENRG